MKKLALTLIVAALPLSALAAECDKPDAEDRIMKAQDAGIVLGMGMIQDTPTIAVDTVTWENASYNVRRGLATTFECMVAGPDNVLREARIVTRGGNLLATWDGVMQELHLE